MAKKTMLEQARKAYNKNQQTKGGQKQAKKDRVKTKKKKEKAVGSSWDSVREKTQTAGKKGEENRKTANVKTIAKNNAEQAKRQTKSGAVKPVKSNWGEVADKARNTKGKTTKFGKVAEGVVAAPVGSFLYHEAKNATDAAGWGSKQAYRAKDTSARNRTKTTTRNDRRNANQTALAQKQLDEHKKIEDKTKIYQTDKNGKIKTDKNGNPVLTEYGKGQKEYAKPFKKASKKLAKEQDKTLEHGAQALGLSDEKKFSIPDIPVVNKFLPSTEEQKKATRKSELKSAGLDKKSIQKNLDDIDAYAKEQGFTDDTMLDNGMTYGQYRKELEAGMYADRDSAIKAINENMEKEGVGKFSAKDIYKGGNKALDELADYLIPYGGSAKASLKAAEGILKASKGVKAGKALTTLGDDVVKGLSKGGKKYVREAVENGLKNGENLGDIIKDVSKTVSKSNLKQNIKKELIANAIQDATLGTTIDALKGKQQGLKGKEFKDYMVENAVMNAAFGMPISMIAGRTGKAGKRAIAEEIADEANKATDLAKANGQIAGINNGKVVAQNAETAVEQMSRDEAKNYFTLKEKANNGTIKPEEQKQFNELQTKVKEIFRQTETVSNKVINLKSLKSGDLHDAETAVRFFESTGDQAKLKVAQKALESAKVATRHLNESLDNAMKTMTEKTGIDYKWVTGDEMRTFGADEDSVVKGFTHFDENGKATVLINRESPQAWQTVVGHETMHLIKKSDEKAFNDLGDALEKYAKELDEYDELEAVMRRNYPEFDAKSEDFREEMVSEMLGRYVFGEDDKFIKRLAGENPTALEKIVDYIKNLIKKAKNPELAEQFNKFVDSADEAIRAINKDEVAKNAKEETPKFSIVKKVTAKDGKEYENVVKLDSDLFRGIKNDGERARTFRQFVYDNMAGKKFNAYDQNGKEVTIEIAQYKERHKKDGAKNRTRTINELAVKPSQGARKEEAQLAVEQANELIEVAKYDRASPKNAHGKLDRNGWEYRTLNIMTQKGDIFDAVLNIAKTEDGRNLLYEVKIKKKIGKDVKTADSGLASSNLPKKSVSQAKNNVNTQDTNVAVAFKNAKPLKGKASKEKPADAGSFSEEIKSLDPDYAKNIGTGAKFSKVAKPETLKFLDDQEKAGKTVEVYRAMVEIDGKLYPPMATKIKTGSGKAELQDANNLGEWVQADEHPELLDKDGKFVLRKDNGTSVPAAYNPYIHTSFSPLNDQFTSAYKRPNLVVVKGIVPESELTSGYKATGAKDSVGKTQWHSGVVAGQLPEAREVMLSRWFKPQEVVSDAEVAKTIKQTLGDTGIEIPYNVVTPSLRRELEKIGVPIGEGRGGAPKEIPSLESGKASKEVNAKNIVDNTGKVTKEANDAYMAAAKAGDEETARKYVRALAEAKGGLPAYHGTNARFTVFDPAKLGSKNWNAPSAQMGFFAGKSRQTAEAYTGLDSATAAGRMSFIEEGRADAKAIREKYNADKVDDRFFKDREKFFDQYRKDNGWKEEVDDVLDMLVKDQNVSADVKERLHENLSRQLEYMWNEKHMNDMYAEFEKTDTAVKKREFDAKIYDEWEQKQIERLGYDPHVMELYAFMEKPFIHDFKGEGRDVESFAARMAKAKEQGCDGCMFLNVTDGGELDDIYTVFSNKQFKSADAITKNDNGDIIPLSERFNFAKEDIRFSKEAKDKPLTVKSVISDFTKDSRFAGDEKAFGDEVRELAELMRKDGLTTDVEAKVDDIIAKHIKINEYEEWGEGIDPNVKSLIKSSAINISELGDGTIAHKLENIGLSKADVPSWVQLRSAKGGRSLDSVYHELSDERPDLFPPDASHEDKLLNIIKASRQEPEMELKPKEWIDGEKNDLKYELITKVADADYAERKALEAKAKPKAEPKPEKPKTTKKPAKKKEPKEPEKTEVQKLHENEYASDNVKTALKDIEDAGDKINVAKAEKIAKRFNDLDKKIGAKTKHIENAKKSEKYATEAERTERLAELKDELETLKRRQAKAAGELEQLGKMKAVDPDKTAEQQIKEMRGERKVNKELKSTDNLTKTDNWIKDKMLSVRRLWEDSLIDVEKTAKASGDMELLTSANRVRNSYGVANNWITNVRSKFDNTVGGKSLDSIFNKELIENEPKYADFQEYLIMKHVPARHAKGTDIYPEVSPELAEKRVAELEEKYGKELTDWADDVYDYIKDLQQYRVDSGMLSKEAAEQFEKDYPFYVPTNRVNDESGEIDFFTGGISNGIRSAKGGDNDVLDIYSQLYTATNKTIHAAEENQMLNLYFKAKGVTEEQLKDATLDDLEHAVIEAKVNKRTGASSVSFFVDGKPVRLPCNHQLALGLRELDGLEFERLLKAAKVATLYGKPFKALVTDWNLVFGVRNGARDLQQALVNSKDTRFFASSTGAAAHAIANADSPFRKLYASMGGERAQLVSYDAVARQMGIEKQGRVDAIHEKVQDFVDFQVKGKHVNPIHYVEGINGAIEMMPRMCEFIGTLRKEADTILKGQGSSLKKLRSDIVKEVNELEKAGKIGATNVSAEVENRLANKIIDMVGKDTIDTAMRNANDITLNFGRSGVLGKALNMGFVPYLNPSIQGLSKLVRLFTEAGQEGGWKALASIGMKLGTFTIAPAMLNELLLKDNEDYQNLNTRDKDNNFFIPLDVFGEEWEGKFFKFPKPRENAVLAEPAEYGLRYFLDQTEYAYFDWDKLKMEGVPLWEKIPLSDEGKQSIRTAIDNIGVINPATSNMLSPLYQTFHNKTWYGGTIESAYETSINEDTGKANVPVNKRYDTGTSGIAIKLGQTKVAKELNLSPKKIDNILDSYTGMIYDLGISQTTEEAKTRGNWFTRTVASQFVKDSVFSNKLSTNAWGKMDGMTKKEQDEYKSTYMYDTFKYDDAMDLITGDKNLTNKQKMDAKRALQIKKNKLNREAIDGKPNTSNPLVDIAKHLGATKTLNHFLPDTGGEDTDTWADYFKTYKNAKGYSGLNKAQKEKQSQKFLDVYTLGVKGQLKQDPTKFHDSPSWGMSGVAAAQLARQGKLSGKDADLIMKSCGVYESQTAVYYNYAEHGGNVSRYAVTEKRVGKTLDKVGDWGMDTKSGLWKGTFDKSMGAKGGTIAMSLATSKKVDFKDRAYYIANSSDPQMMEKMNAARGFSEKYGHKTKEISKLALQADALGDGNTYLKNDEIINVCNQMKGNNEEKSMAYVLLGGKPGKNPFGAIGNYAHDGDTGIQSLEDDGSGGGHGRRRRRGRRGHGGGGGGSKKGTMPKTESGAIKGKVSNPFSTSNGSKDSNLNDAYRKKVRKLRKELH